MAKVRGGKPRMSAEDRRWQAQDDLRTLQRAKEIQGSRARMAAAKKEATEQVRAITSATRGKAK